MHSTTVAVDLAKNVFELAVADARVASSRSACDSIGRDFARFFVHRDPCRVVMEACGSAHYWARRIAACGHDGAAGAGPVCDDPTSGVTRPIEADAAALLEAGALRRSSTGTDQDSRSSNKSWRLHRLRSQWQCTRQRYLNTLRGLLREFGIRDPARCHTRQVTDRTASGNSRTARSLQLCVPVLTADAA